MTSTSDKTAGSDAVAAPARKRAAPRTAARKAPKAAKAAAKGKKSAATDANAGVQPFSEKEIRDYARDFHDHGFIHIKNAFSPEYIQELYDYFMDTYASYFEDKEFDNALQVGNKRTMLTIDIKGPFNKAAFYANERIMPVITTLLGENVILGSIGGVTSLPGAEIQHLHRDHPILFGDDHDVSPMLPPYAITVILPLVPVTALNGCTRMYSGSHVLTSALSQARPTVDPYTELGDCVFMDYRMMHQGMANNSDSLRPILYITYYRPWFRDFRNYYKQSPINITTEEFNRMPSEHRHLVEWLFRERG